MTQSHENVTEASAHADARAFRLLIDKLDGDDVTAGDAYNGLRASIARFFSLKHDTDPEAAADVTINRLASKLGQGTQIENITAYAFGIARLVYLERRRSVERERKAGSELYSLRSDPSIADDGDDSVTRMKKCFESLPADDRSLLRDYYAPMTNMTKHERREHLSGKIGISLNALRLRVHRLRQRLADCLERQKAGG